MKASADLASTLLSPFFRQIKQNTSSASDFPIKLNPNLIWEGIGNKEIDKPSKSPDALIAAAIAGISKISPGFTAK